MNVQADDLLAALTPPSVTIGGVTYTGRILSYFEFMPYRDEMLRFNEGELTTEQALAFLTRYFREVFPKRWLGPDPVPKLMKLPETVLAQVVKSFFTLQLAATPGVLRGIAPKTTGTDSLTPTTSAIETPTSTTETTT